MKISLYSSYFGFLVLASQVLSQYILKLVNIFQNYVGMSYYPWAWILNPAYANGFLTLKFGIEKLHARSS